MQASEKPAHQRSLATTPRNKPDYHVEPDPLPAGSGTRQLARCSPLLESSIRSGGGSSPKRQRCSHQIRPGLRQRHSPEKFLTYRRRQTARVGLRRYGTRCVIWPRWKRSRLRFCWRWRARPAQFFDARADHREIVSSAGAGHVSSISISVLRIGGRRLTIRSALRGRAKFAWHDRGNGQTMSAYFRWQVYEWMAPRPPMSQRPRPDHPNRP
jgi:hypothetical protein